MASSDLPDATSDLPSADPAPSDPQPDPTVVQDSSPIDPIPAIPVPLTAIPPENVESSNMQDVEVVLTELDLQTPLPISQVAPPPPTLVVADPEEAGSSRRRGRKRGGAAVVGEFLEPEQFPEWIPKDWKVLKRPRPSGPLVDTYYLPPDNTRQLRSKKEVLAHLSGSLTEKPKRVNKKDAAAKALNFESEEPINAEPIPEKVGWVYTHSGDSWTPFIGEKRVPEHVRLEWKAKFGPLIPTNEDSTA